MQGAQRIYIKLPEAYGGLTWSELIKHNTLLLFFRE